jgi:amino acid adenylation domain-containing protein
MERLAVIIEDTRCSLIIASDNIDEMGVLEMKKLLGPTVKIRCYKDLEFRTTTTTTEEESGVRGNKKKISDNPNSLGGGMYIIFTSGSTGKPKGMEMSHLNFLNFFHNYRKIIGLAAGDVFGMYCSIAFDLSLSEIFTSLLSGLHLKIIPADVRKSGEAMSRFIKQEKINGLFVTPVTLRMLERTPLKGLRSITIAGDACDYETMRYWAKDRVFIHGYGPAETTIITHGKLWDDSHEFNNVGKQFLNVTQYVLDKDMNPLPFGVPGEIYLGGFQTTPTGYMNRKTINETKFLPNPFLEGDVVYRTGDWGKLTPVGELLILGRVDSQVKIRGFRIELGEIESCLRTHPKINNAVVMVKRVAVASSTQQKEKEKEKKKTMVSTLVAFIELFAKTSRPPLTKEDVRRFLETKLAYYMIPNKVVILDEFPQNANNKVDKPKLWEAVEEKRPLVGESTPKRLQRIVYDKEDEFLFMELAVYIKNTLSKLLDLFETAQIFGLDANIFELGLDSLTVEKFLALLSKRIGIQVSAEALNVNNTVAKLTEYLVREKAQNESSTPLKEKQSPQKTLRRPVVSFAQERMFILHKQHGTSGPYNCIYGIRITEGTLDKCGLEDAINEMIARHSVLRTNFVLSDDGQSVVPKIHDKRPLKIVEYSSEKEEEEGAALEREVNYNFVIEDDLLIRCCVFGGKLVLFNIHHIVWDHWSIFVFFEQLSELYNGKKKKKNIEEKQTTTIIVKQYHEFARDQRRRDFKDGLEFWKKELLGAPPILRLPVDFNPRQKGCVGRMFHHPITSELLTPKVVRECAANMYSSSGYLLCLAVFGTLIIKYSQQNDVVFGVPVSNRDLNDDVRGMIGLFINSLPFRVKTPKDSDRVGKREMVEMVSKTYSRIIKRQDVPIEKIVQEAKVKRVSSYNPLFQVMFIFFNNVVEDGMFSLDGLEYEYVHSDDLLHYTQFEINMFVKFYKEQIVVSASYSTDLFKEETIKKFCEDYETLLGWFCGGKCTDFETPSLPYRLGDQAEFVGGESKDSTDVGVGVGVGVMEKKVEKLLKREFCKALNRKAEIGIDEDFFELGGYSLLQTTLLRNLRLQNVLVTNQAFKENPTIRKLKRYLLMKGDGNYKAQSVIRSFPFGGNQVIPEVRETAFTVSFSGLNYETMLNKFLRVTSGVPIVDFGSNTQHYPKEPIINGNSRSNDKRERETGGGGDGGGGGAKMIKPSNGFVQIHFPRISFDLTSIKMVLDYITSSSPSSSPPNTTTQPHSFTYYRWLEFLRYKNGANKQSDVGSYSLPTTRNGKCSTSVVRIRRDSDFANVLRFYRVDEIELILAYLVRSVGIDEIVCDVQMSGDRELVLGIDLENVLGNIDPVFRITLKNTEKIEQLLLRTKLWFRLGKQKRLLQKNGLAGFGSTTSARVQVLCFTDGNFCGRGTGASTSYEIKTDSYFFYDLTLLLFFSGDGKEVRCQFYYFKDSCGWFNTVSFLKAAEGINKFCLKNGEALKSKIHDNIYIQSIIDTFRDPSEEYLVGLQEFGERAPIYFVHPDMGNSSTYLYFSNMINKTATAPQPFFGLNYPHYVENKSFEKMRDLVKFYADLIKGNQARGPYIIGGYSLGAVIVLELYKLMAAEVDVLITVDAIPRKLLELKSLKQYKNFVLKEVLFNPSSYGGVVELAKTRKLVKERGELFLNESNKSIPEVGFFLKSRKKLIKLVNTVDIGDLKVKCKWICIRTTNKSKVKLKQEAKKFRIYEDFLCPETDFCPYIIKSGHWDVLNKEETAGKVAKIINREVGSISSGSDDTHRQRNKVSWTREEVLERLRKNHHQGWVSKLGNE